LISRKICKPVEKVYWVTDRDCTLLVQETRGEVYRLAGVEQLVWDCLILGYSLKKVKALIIKMGMVDAGLVDKEMASILDEWQHRNLVEIVETTNG
jgi:hypothetical protein